MLSGCMNPIEEAREEGYAAGYEDGYEEGRREALDCVESTDGSAEDAYYDCA